MSDEQTDGGLGIPLDLIRENSETVLVNGTATKPFDQEVPEKPGKTDPAEDNESETPSDLLKTYYFGFSFFHPEWLQILANKKVFTVLMCCYIVLSGSVVAGINSVNVSSLEVRFSLSSTLAALIFVIYDVAVIIFTIFISYFGGRTHKPRVLGITLIVLGVGNIITASPQFFFGLYKEPVSANATMDDCSVESIMNNADTDTCTSTNIGAYIIILIGQVFLAFGSTSIYTVAIAYIDEIVYPRFVSLHIGVVLTFGVVGPAIGYLLGSGLLSVYVDPGVETDLTPDDPNWVGAWWIGPLLMGILSFILATPFFMFPKWLPDSHLVSKERTKEMAKTYSAEFVHENNLTLIVKQFPIQIKDLLTNVSYMSTCFALAMIFVIKDGVVTFGPKYIESMFRLTPTAAGLLVGGLGVTGAAFGVITGALIVYFWKPTGRRTAIVQLVVVLASIPFVLVFLIKCPSYNVAGVIVPYPDGTLNGRDESICSGNCSCSSTEFDPVCGSDGITYFSPCRAGCLRTEINGSIIFENCSCIAYSQMANDTTLMSNIMITSNATAEDGLCPTDCNQLIFFAIVLFILVFLLLTIEIPYYHYTLRVVADDQRPLALGLQSALYRTFGSVPGPLLFGAVVDLACVDWDYNCGIRGNCWIYDNDQLSFNAIMLCLPFALVSLLLLFIGFLTYPRQRSLAAVSEGKDVVDINNSKEEL